MNLKKYAVVAAMFLTMSNAGVALAGTATFTGVEEFTTSYSEAGITFDDGTYAYGMSMGGWVVPDAFTGNFCCNPAYGAIRITQTGGGLFTLSSLDVISDTGLGYTTFVGSNGANYLSTTVGSVSFGSMFENVSYVDWNILFFTYSTIDNVTISAVTPVPEPETYAMLLAGLGILGIAARRRKQKAV